MAQKENIEEIIGMRLQNVFSKEVLTIVSNKYLPKAGQVRLALAKSRLESHRKEWNLLRAEVVEKTPVAPVVEKVVEVDPLPEVVINDGFDETLDLGSESEQDVFTSKKVEKTETPKPAKKTRAKKAKKK